MNTPTSRRRGIVYLDAALVLRCLSFPPSKGDTYVALQWIDGIPSGAKIVSVNADWSRNCIAVMIEHEDLGEVPEGIMPPNIGTHMQMAVRTGYLPLHPKEEEDAK